jgi:hypothetical protein
MSTWLGEYRVMCKSSARASETRCGGGVSVRGSVLGVLSRCCRLSDRCSVVGLRWRGCADEREPVRPRAACVNGGAGPAMALRNSQNSGDEAGRRFFSVAEVRRTNCAHRAI